MPKLQKDPAHTHSALLQETTMSIRLHFGDVLVRKWHDGTGGLDGNELIDASPLAVEIAHRLNGNTDFVNLPRKFKFTVSGCPVWCSFPEINDAALTCHRRCA